jgi:hypothetical protein
MLRCTKQLRVLRDTNLINYTDIRQYVRGYQPRDPFFKDEPDTTANQQNEPNVDEASVLRNNNPQNEPNLNVDEASPLRNAAETPGVAAVLPNEPNLNVDEASVLRNNNPQNEPIEAKIENRQSSIENCVEPLPKDWAKKVLDKVHYPLHKRRMSRPKLDELADSVLMTLEDPEKFLRDLAEEQTARPPPNALAAVAC